MDKQVLKLLFSKLDERKESITESLAAGAASDYADYQRLCGVVTGLLTAQREIQDLATKLKETDED